MTYPADVCLLTTVGSRAYGLDTPESDVDIRGVFVTPTAQLLGLHPPPITREYPDPDTTLWELAHFIKLALAANPLILEVLWTHKVEFADEIGAELRQLRTEFLSMRLATTYLGYARSEWEKYQKNPDNHKQAMHMIRVLAAGAHVLRTGDVMVLATSRWRNTLLDIRAGRIVPEGITYFYNNLCQEIRLLEAEQPFPPTPPTDEIEAFLIRVRKQKLTP